MSIGCFTSISAATWAFFRISVIILLIAIPNNDSLNSAGNFCFTASRIFTIENYGKARLLQFLIEQKDKKIISHVKCSYGIGFRKDLKDCKEILLTENRIILNLSNYFE